MLAVGAILEGLHVPFFFLARDGEAGGTVGAGDVTATAGGTGFG